MEKAASHAATAKPKANIQMKTSSATVTLIASLAVLFLLVNIAICSILYFKKRKHRLRERTLPTTHNSRAEIGEVDVIGQKSAKDDKSALQTFKNGCSVIKSMSFNKVKNGSKRVKKKSHFKSPKSDDSGGFRERFQLRRHLSTSTLDAHTKVRDWIANEVMHRCSPAILRKSNSDLNSSKHMSVAKPFTRSEELLSDNKINKKEPFNICDINIKKNTDKTYNSKTRTSEKTTSTSALGSHSSIGSHKQSLKNNKQASKSSDSIISKATDSIKSKKVSVAIDATPSARTNSILKQEPIEISKSFDYGNSIHSNTSKQLKRSRTEENFASVEKTKEKKHNNENNIYTNEVTLTLGVQKPLVISHKHSSSDPVSDVNYEQLYRKKMAGGPPVIDILPPLTFRNEINVTSRDESARNEPMTAEEALQTIKRRNFPKVLPDLPKAQKRLSLQPNSLQTFRSSSGSNDSQSDHSKVPPIPPPRTTTLERRLAYVNTKPLSSFSVSSVKKTPETSANQNYENIDSLYSNTNQLLNKSSETIVSTEKYDAISSTIMPLKNRAYPKMIIISNDIPDTPEPPKIIIKPSSSQTDIPSNVPRVTLPDDFHSQSGSFASFSSVYSEDDDEEHEGDLFDDIGEDKLIQELVGGVESPTNMGVLDSKGPETIFEKKIEIVSVKVNPGQLVPKDSEQYVCISNLHLPDIDKLEPTAKIKPNFGLNKLKNRTESINRPPEKVVKVKQRKSIKPTSLINIVSKSRINDKKSDASKLEHSNSGSSNDTESSTGTVKKVEVKK